MLNKFKNILITIIFIFCFLGSLALLLSNKDKPEIELIIFGQLFVIFGIIGIINFKVTILKGKDLILMLFPIVGITCIIIGILQILQINNINEIFPYVISFSFIIFGVLSIIGRRIYNNYLVKNCTKEVLGEIVSIDSFYDEGHRLYTPVYEINHNGNKIRIKSDEYSNVDRYEIGRFDDLLINPSNPNEFIFPQKNGNRLVMIIGFLSIVSGIITLICMLNII